jgi:hypothetical protein
LYAVAYHAEKEWIHIAISCQFAALLRAGDGVLRIIADTARAKAGTSG